MSDLLIHRAEMDRPEEMASLWCAAFPGDPQEYVLDFLTDLPRETVALIGEHNDRIVTMLFLLPARARFRDATYPVRYLYAGCTHPQYRGRGYYQQLMTAAARTVEAMGENGIYLHPADAALTTTYKRMGYRSGIFGGSPAVWPRDLCVCDTIDDYLQQREQISKRLADHTVIWETADSITRRFVSDAVSAGARMAADTDCIQLTLNDNVLEALCVDGHYTNNDYCLWLPINNTPLAALMTAYSGFTGLVGD